MTNDIPENLDDMEIERDEDIYQKEDFEKIPTEKLRELKDNDPDPTRAAQAAEELLRRGEHYKKMP